MNAAELSFFHNIHDQIVHIATPKALLPLQDTLRPDLATRVTMYASFYECYSSCSDARVTSGINSGHGL